MKQIEIVQSKKFVLFGEIAFSVSFPILKLKDFRGKIMKEDRKEFFIRYHSAAGLRSPKIKKILKN